MAGFGRFGGESPRSEILNDRSPTFFDPEAMASSRDKTKTTKVNEEEEMAAAEPPEDDEVLILLSP